MAIKKIKISKLPLADTLAGLCTIGVDALNKSVRISLEFLKTAADGANEAALKANNAADGIQQVVDSKVTSIPGKGLSTNDYTDLDVAEVRKIGSKEDAQIVKTIAGAVVEFAVAGGHTYRCGELAALTISSVEDSAREAVIRFTTGTAAPAFNFPASLGISGDRRPRAMSSCEINICLGEAIINWRAL